MAVGNSENRWVTLNGPMRLEGQLILDLQLVYSKAKCGVDGSEKLRAKLRSQPSPFDWEWKAVTQTLKILLINSFLAWSSIQLDAE